MTDDSAEPSLTRVAVGAVVEKVSTVDQLEPAAGTAPPWRDGSEKTSLRVLISLRSAERVLAGCWELPGGKIEQGESPERAVVRELSEELGIAVKPVEALPAVRHRYKHGGVCLLPFICRRVRGLPSAIEVDDVRWVHPEGLGAYRFPEATGPVIHALLNALGLKAPDPPPAAR